MALHIICYQFSPCSSPRYVEKKTKNLLIKSTIWIVAQRRWRWAFFCEIFEMNLDNKISYQRGNWLWVVETTTVASGIDITAFECPWKTYLWRKYFFPILLGRNFECFELNIIEHTFYAKFLEVFIFTLCDRHSEYSCLLLVCLSFLIIMHVQCSSARMLYKCFFLLWKLWKWVAD